MSSERHSTASDADTRIERALADLDPQHDVLSVTRALRRALPPTLAREAAERFDLRRRASEKFPHAARGRFTRKGIEQATRLPVARARAARIAELAPGALCYDATCGLGADAIALADAGLPVVAGDLDPTVVACARANLGAAGHPEWALVANACNSPVLASIVLLDPDRRAEGRRSLRPAEWSPTLEAALRIAARHDGACIKLAPAADHETLHDFLPPGLAYRLQWVSHERELCEVALWTGSLAGTAEDEGGIHEVLALTSGRGPADSVLAGRPAEVVSPPPAEVSEIQWLCDPDPAVVRSGLLGRLATDLNLAPVGPGLAWLGGTSRPESPLLRSWKVLAHTSADPKRVRALLREHEIGPVRVIKRGHPDRPEVLERRFRGRGSKRGLLAVARLEQGHVALLLEGEGPPSEAGTTL